MKSVERRVALGKSCPNKTALLKYMEQIESEDQLIYHACSWIADGWELEARPSPEQIAAALFLEARFQDGCVASGDSVASYPVRLREVARNIINILNPDPVREAALAVLEQVEREGKDTGMGDAFSKLRVALNPKE